MGASIWDKTRIIKLMEIIIFIKYFSTIPARFHNIRHFSWNSKNAYRYWHNDKLRYNNQPCHSLEYNWTMSVGRLRRCTF